MSERAADETESPEPPEPPPARSGLAVAREALAAARSAARRRGEAVPGRRALDPAPDVTAGPPGAGGGAVARGSRRVDPARRSGPGPDERDPQLLNGSIERLVAERGWTTDVAVGGALARWPELMGAELAAHCRPESFTNTADGEDAGELVLVADSTAWATQVRLLVPALQRRLDDELGAGVVRRIRVLGPSAPSWRRGPLSVRGRGPRDTYG